MNAISTPVRQAALARSGGRRRRARSRRRWPRGTARRGSTSRSCAAPSAARRSTAGRGEWKRSTVGPSCTNACASRMPDSDSWKSALTTASASRTASYRWLVTRRKITVAIASGTITVSIQRASSSVHQQQGDADAHERDQRDQGLEQAVLDQGLELVDVGGHPGHDPAGHLALVVVEREPLQLGPDPDAQAGHDPLAGAAGHEGLGDLVEEVDQRDQQERRGGPPQHLGRRRPRPRCRCRCSPARGRGARRPRRARPAAARGRTASGTPRPAAASRTPGRAGSPSRGRARGGRAPAAAPRPAPAAPGSAPAPAASRCHRMPGPRVAACGSFAARRSSAARTASARPTALPGLGRDVELGQRLDRVADRRGGLVVEAGQQLAVRRVARHQLVVGAVVGHPPVVEEHDPVGEVERGDAVGDDQRRASVEHLAQAGEDALLGGGVDRAGGVVEQQDPRVDQHRASQGDALTLAAGQAEPALADAWCRSRRGARG